MFSFIKKYYKDILPGFPQSYWYLWFGTLINRSGTLVIPFFSIYLTTQRGISVSQATLIVSLYGIGSFFSSIGGGVLADRLGRRTTMMMSLFSTAVAMFLLGLAQSLLSIALLAMLVGFATDLYRPAASAAIADMLPPLKRSYGYGWIYWAINFGAAIAPIIAGYIAHIAYVWLFIVDAATTFLFGWVILFCVSETSSSTSRSTEQRITMSGMKTAFGDRFLLALTFLTFLFSCIYFQGYVTLPIYMHQYGLGTEQYGIVIAMNGLVIVLCSIPINRLLHHFSHASVLCVASLLMGTGFGILWVMHTVPFYALTVCIWTLGELCAAPISSVLVSDISPEHLRGTYIGIFGTSWCLASFAGPVVGGFVFDRFGAFTLWSSCFCIGLLVACGYLLVFKRCFSSKDAGAN